MIRALVAILYVGVCWSQQLGVPPPTKLRLDSEGASLYVTIAVVDPQRGETWVQHGARFGAKQKGAVSVEWYKDPDWELLQQGQTVKAYRTQRYDLDELLRRPVIQHQKAH